MVRVIFVVLVLVFFVACSKNDTSTPPVVIPDNIEGVAIEFQATPINITTPDKSSLVVSMNNTRYKVDLSAASQSQSNASVIFASDSVLTNDSREFANLGKDAVSYHPVAPNEITIRFTDGRKVVGWFDLNTDFGGVFGEAIITTWRNPGDPSKPNQKAKDDLSNFLKRYSDADGSGPGSAPTYFFVQVSKL